MNLNSLDIENNMLLQHSQKLFWIYEKFSSKHVSVWCQKKTFVLHRFLTHKTAFLKHFERKCPFISVYPRKKRRSKILSDGGWVVGKLNNFIKAARFLSLVKCFILIEIFVNSTIFQHFNTSIYSIKTMKFSRHFGLRG